MYSLLMFLIFASGAGWLMLGLARERKSHAVGGGIVLFAGIALFVLLSFWAEMLWFSALGHGTRFWTALFAVGSAGLIGGLMGALIVYLLTLPIPKEPPFARIWPEVLGIVVGGGWGVENWETVLKYLNRVGTEVVDPILSRDTGFYLFVLPFYDSLYWFLLTLAAIGVLASGVYVGVPRHREEVSRSWWERGLDRSYSDYKPLYMNLGALALVVAWGHYLNIFHLMYSRFGAVAGPGWTDVTIRLPAFWIVAAVTAAAGFVLAIPSISRRLHAWNPWGSESSAPATTIGIPLASVLIVWALALVVTPGLVQWLAVEPNEITIEKPYIEHNIKFTRRGFQLDKIEERRFPASGRFTQETVDENRYLLSQIRLWDPRALVQVYKQFQEIRLYYEFPDVDIDRYKINGKTRQVMVSPREMRLSNLPRQSQTFVNRHFKYTHGYGMTLAPVNEFTSDGLPDLLVKDLPPKTEAPSLEIERPQIYYGELTNSYAVVNSREKEFDYPRGEENAYNRYDGGGGVQLSNLWRRFVFGWEMGGTRLFFSGYPTAESRIMLRRQVRQRAQALAPFLHFDQDPYIVLANGRLYWILDAYTASSHYPYSEPFASTQGSVVRDRPSMTTAAGAGYLHGANYIRNAVKAVIDAYEGTVHFYIFEPEDPIIQVWQRIFPGLFKSHKEMPPELLEHIRYPEGFLLAQGLVFAKYHMTDPTVFYNQEDLWVRATEKYYSAVQPVEPYYVMWQPPESDETEFVQILPFTPKNRQVMIGWIAGMCDPENYGRLLAYRFPKEKRILGPQQVETKIDQDSHLSGQLTLWDQRGSNVIRGNVLAIPIGDTLLYVEPIYLQAEAAAYPELRLVALMHGDRLSYAETFEEALKGLYGDAPTPSAETQPVTGPGDRSLAELASEANKAFDRYVQSLGAKRFDDAGKALEDLSSTLDRLDRQASSTAGNADSETDMNDTASQGQ